MELLSLKKEETFFDPMYVGKVSTIGLVSTSVILLNVSNIEKPKTVVILEVMRNNLTWNFHLVMHSFSVLMYLDNGMLWTSSMDQNFRFMR